MPVGDDISALTDWVELRVTNGQAGLPLTQLDRLLKAEGSELADEELAGDLDEDEADDDAEVNLSTEDAAAAEIDVRVELVRQEVLERATIGERIYPFTVEGERVRPREVCGAHVYRLLLVLGSAELPYRRERRANEVEEAYDHIAMAALRQFLGREADGRRFARTAHHDTNDQTPDPQVRPTGFADAIAWLRELLEVGRGVRDPLSEPDTGPHWEEEQDEGEPLPDAPASLPGRVPLSSYNDAGVDVVAWSRFADGRSGFPVILAQCTVQVAWEAKLQDIDLNLWQKWIDFDTVPPQRALVIPFADRRDHPLWRDRTAKAGLILDRVRLVELLDKLECGELDRLVDERVRAWTQAEIAAA